MKSEVTLALEREIWDFTHKQSTFGCFEVTIGWFGNQRVDFMTYNTNNEFRCYEIKTSKSDFFSKSKTTFVGHYNYFVLTAELFNEVKGEIKKGVGIYVGGRGLIKKARRQELIVDRNVLMSSMIRSLCREFAKQMDSGNPTKIEIYNREIAQHKRMAEFYRKDCLHMEEAVRKRFGRDWRNAMEIYNESGRKDVYRDCQEE